MIEHGNWGPWRLNRHAATLDLHDDSGGYWVDLERCDKPGRDSRLDRPDSQENLGRRRHLGRVGPRPRRCPATYKGVSLPGRPGPRTMTRAQDP